MHLRLVTYNIHKCIGGLDRRFDPGRVRDVLVHYRPDLVFLQEVDAHAERSRFHRLSDLLGDMLGLRHRSWFPNVTLRKGGQYGNAILTRFPIIETRNIDLTVGWRKRRSVLHVRCRVRLQNGRSRTLHLYNLHLGLSGGERRVQLERLLASEPLCALDRRAPVVVAGDLNDVWGTLGARFLSPAGFASSPPLPTFPAYAPMRPLDGIYVRGSLSLEHCQRARVAAARQASDHLPLIADLRLV
jgi:endonuclease/exonuclease/phosphatase family metal-dependent hydrolase